FLVLSLALTPPPPRLHPLSLHAALPISELALSAFADARLPCRIRQWRDRPAARGDRGCPLVSPRRAAAAAQAGLHFPLSDRSVPGAPLRPSRASAARLAAGSAPGPPE